MRYVNGAAGRRRGEWKRDVGEQGRGVGRGSV
jgi:hypothetical protein